MAPEPGVRGSGPWMRPDFTALTGNERRDLLAEAEGYLRGEYRLLNVPFSEAHLDWHRDPVSGRSAPTTFGPDINYRDPSIVGNVKNIWEKNRHHHLTVLAAAYGISGDNRFAAEVDRQLRDWVQENPFPRGVNWNSSLELGVRLIAWVWIDRLLRDSEVHAGLFGEKGVLWPAIYWHQWMIDQHHSGGSSANNHLIGEMAGLYTAALVWPVFAESRQWKKAAQAILEREIFLQTFQCGLNREQAFAYHIFALEFFLLSGLEADRYGQPFSAEYRQQVVQMLEVIPGLTDVGGNLPRYGDGDEGMALQVRPTSSSRTAWLYRVGRRWLRARVPMPIGGQGELMALTVWSNGEDVVPSQPTIMTPLTDDAGLYVLCNGRGTPQEMFCLADAGPLGFLSIAAHGHADALSITLSVGGVPVLVDPGTYVYHSDSEARGYFRSTAAHNTVVVDELDQSVAHGTFLWLRKAEARLLHWEETASGAIWEAEHDGYTRLPGEVVHRRRVELDERVLRIDDRLEGRGEHRVEVRFHFAPHCKVDIQGTNCVIQWSSGHALMALDPCLTWEVLRSDPRGGWFSAGFNLREPSSTLVGTMRVVLPVGISNRMEVTL